MAMKVRGLDLVVIIRPDDWHLHLRYGRQMQSVLKFSAERFERALIMPNLNPPVTTTAQAWIYYEEIRAAARNLGGHLSGFSPLMTLYLTDETSPRDVYEAKVSNLIYGVKLYPAGVTTNSAAGVTDILKVYQVLEAMEMREMVLNVHGEVNDPAVDVYDREEAFIERVMEPITKKFPSLRIVFEHVTTRAAVEYVKGAGENIAATITAHHLLSNRNDMLADGIRPHLYCKPILKGLTDQRALIEAATSGNRKFFLGTDSAPHEMHTKEAACGCPGCFTAHASIELYAEVFEKEGALDRLEGFASRFGAVFYGLPINTDIVTLVKKDRLIPPNYPYGEVKGRVIPLRHGGSVSWSIEGI